MGDVFDSCVCDTRHIGACSIPGFIHGQFVGRKESEVAEKLDGLGVFNAIHEVAEKKGPGSRYNHEPGPMEWWNQKGRTEILPDFTVEVVETFSDSGEVNYYEHPQGWNGKCFIIFKVTPHAANSEPVFYKHEGVVDSYDGEHWDGKFLPVSPKVENVTVYTWDEHE